MGLQAQFFYRNMRSFVPGWKIGGYCVSFYRQFISHQVLFQNFVTCLSRKCDGSKALCMSHVHKQKCVSFLSSGVTTGNDELEDEEVASKKENSVDLTKNNDLLLADQSKVVVHFSSTQDKLDQRLFNDQVFEEMCRGKETVPLARLQRALLKCGLWKNDPRLKESMKVMSDVTEEARKRNEVNAYLDLATFRSCIQPNIVLIKSALSGNLIIPEFEKFCRVIDGIYENCRMISDGKVANYIPQLSKYNPDYWGVSVCTVDGQRHSIGDVEVPFTMQSSGKPINYALTLNELGEDTVHQYVGHEPSGETFNKIKLSHSDRPHNPMINAGAIMIASLLHRGHSAADRFDYVINQYRKINGGEFIGFNNSVFLSEKEWANRNYALGYYMMEKRCFPEGTNLQETMDLYFQLCSIESNANSAAVMAASLANGGYCPITGDEVFSATSVRNTLTLMHSCGMYNYSGGFAFKVGLPAKSSVSGAILLVVPNLMGICLWSPPLDGMGNSVRGVQFCKELVHHFNFHNYDNLKHTKKKQDPRLLPSDVKGNIVVKLLFGAYSGDLTALRRLAVAGYDLSMADYDSRTALHLAASEGHLDCVRFLVEKCGVPLEPKDRWGHTPYDNAVHFGMESVEKYLAKYLKGEGV